MSIFTFRPTTGFIRLLYNQKDIQFLQQCPARNMKRWVAPTLKELYRRRQKVGPERLSPRSTFLEWNYEAEIFAYGKRLGENFHKDTLKQALTNKSYVDTKKLSKENVEEPQIELADNIQLIKEGHVIITDFINSEMRKHYVEDLAISVSKYLTTEDMLSHVARYMGLADIILTSEYPVERETLSNTLKAVVAALKHSDSLERAQVFVKDFIISQLNGKDIFQIWNLENSYDYLNNLLKEKGINELEPRLCNESASNTILANYQVGLYSNKKLLGIGWGESIDIAKETAALDAIKKMFNVKE